MAAANILASGSTAATSADVVVSANTIVAFRTGYARDAQVLINLKDEVGGYNLVGILNEATPSVVLIGLGTYQFVRVAGATCSVFSG